MRQYKTKAEFYQAIHDAGHELLLDEDGVIDIFVFDIDHHNGPGCSLCGDSWCHHCRDVISISQCPNKKKK